jgi:hypothetical protein
VNLSTFAIVFITSDASYETSNIVCREIYCYDFRLNVDGFVTDD